MAMADEASAAVSQAAATTITTSTSPNPSTAGSALGADDDAASAAGAAGIIVNVTLRDDGPLGVSFEQHPDPMRRHCARIKHLLPGGQAIAADRNGMLRPGLVLLRLGGQDMTQFHAYSAAISYIRATTKRPITLSFMTE